MAFGGLFGWFQKSPSFEPWGDRPAIYEHIVAHIDASTGRLKDSGLELPDEPEDDGQIRWAAGAFDGVMGHHSGGEEEAERVAALHEAIRRAVKKPTPANLRSLHQVTSDGTALEAVDPLIESIGSKQDMDAGGLIELAKWLAKNAPDRESVKLAMALMNLVSDDEAIDILETLATHEEFTLFALVAISNTIDDAGSRLFAIAQKVTGWGRIHAIERLGGVEDPRIQSWLLREGYANDVMYEYTALICAETGRLVDALRAESVDDALMVGAGKIICSLIEGGPAEDIDDFEAGAEATKLFVTHVTARHASIEDLLAVSRIRRFLKRDQDNWSERSERGWTSELRDALLERCEAIISDPSWRERVEQGLASSNESTFWLASAAADALGIESWDARFARLLEQDDDSLWYEVARTPDSERFDQVLDLCRNRVALDHIASGPAMANGLGEDYQEHSRLEWVLQELHRFPGKGWDLIRAAMQSPVVRNRHMALRALGAWGKPLWNDEVQGLLERALDAEPDEDVGAKINEVLKGEVLLESLPQAQDDD